MRRQSVQNRRVITWLLSLVLIAAIGWLVYRIEQTSHQATTPTATVQSATTADTNSNRAVDKLAQLPVKDTEPGDDYERSNFSSGWASWRDCNVRQKILNRDVKNIKLASNGCTVISGALDDPYSGQTIELTTKTAVSKKVQIDHVVALSNAWQTGARYLSADQRKELANDDLELIAVSSNANQDKSDGDASEWLPENKGFRCAYVARQIAVKIKYSLWVTPAEKSAMSSVLSACPNEPLPAQ